MWRWVTRTICGWMLISVCCGRRYVEIDNVVDMWVCVRFGVQREEVCGDG